jgi:hypothetical protein
MTFERYPGTGAWTSDRAWLTSVAPATKGRRFPLHQYPFKTPFATVCDSVLVQAKPDLLAQG